jgi:hypothetical protein
MMTATMAITIVAQMRNVLRYVWIDSLAKFMRMPSLVERLQLFREIFPGSVLCRERDSAPVGRGSQVAGRGNHVLRRGEKIARKPFPDSGVHCDKCAHASQQN